MLPIPFNDDWSFKKENLGDHPLSDAVEGPLSVPHNAMIYETRSAECLSRANSGYYPGGRYRYSKTIAAQTHWKDRCIILEFEGVYHRSQVFVNGSLAGSRPSGYALFHIAMEGHLKLGQDNLIEVLVDTTDEPNSRWYSGSGIYRPVSLYIGPKSLHISPLGVQVSTLTLDSEKAAIQVVTDLEGTNNPTSRHSLSIVIRNANGQEVHSVLVTTASSPSVRKEIVVGNVQPSPSSPYLYQIEVALMDAGRVVDSVVDTFGIRTITVDTTHGLQLNGRSVKLRGACIHHDNGVLGAATLQVAEDRRVRVLKQNGYNSIRSAHNPRSCALLRACDRHGILVMDKLTDVWYLHKSKHDYGSDFEEFWERDMEAMVRRGFNHPSVIIYSIGNEIGETALKRGKALNAAMSARIRELDPTRPNTNALNPMLSLLASEPVEGQAPTPFPGQVEDPKAPVPKTWMDTIFGENGKVVFTNWVAGAFMGVWPYMARLSVVDGKQKETFASLDIAGYNYMVARYELDLKKYPDRIICGTETGTATIVEAWALIEKHPRLIGDFVWTGWDYLGESNFSGIVYGSERRPRQAFPALLSGSAVVDITGHSQTQAYLNQIVWGLRSAPHLAVRPVNCFKENLVTIAMWRTTDSIDSWSWEGYEGSQTLVEVYSSSPKVVLVLNGKKIGQKSAGSSVGYLARFQITYQPGTLVAISYDQQGEETGRDTLISAGSTLKLSVNPEVESLRSDGQDLAFIPVHLTDENGIVRPLADRPVTVLVEGEGSLFGFGSAEVVTSETFVTNTHSTYQGRALAVVRAGLRKGQIRIVVKAEGCADVKVALPVL